MGKSFSFIRVLNDRRFIYEMIGDETCACDGGKNEERD